MPISENIKILRDKYNLSQKELAEIAGVSDKAVSTWENGSKEPRMGAIQKIADYFGLKKSNIIEDDGLHLDFTICQATPLSKKQKLLDEKFLSLNASGQDKAIDYVADLADNPKYQKEDEAHETETPYIPEVLAAHHTTGKLDDEDREIIDGAVQFIGKLKREKGEL